MKTRKNNKGFSLVELIVVVAIMAVLVGVLAPAYMRYVEKTRLQKDNSAIAEIAEAMKIASLDEKVSAVMTMDVDMNGDGTNDAKGYKITLTNSANANATVDFATGTADAMKTELAGVIGSFTTTSKTYNASATAITVSVAVDSNGKTSVATTGVITVPNATTADSPQPTF